MLHLLAFKVKGSSLLRPAISPAFWPRTKRHLLAEPLFIHWPIPPQARRPLLQLWPTTTVNHQVFALFAGRPAVLLLSMPRGLRHTCRYSTSATQELSRPMAGTESSGKSLSV